MSSQTDREAFYDNSRSAQLGQNQSYLGNQYFSPGDQALAQQEIERLRFSRPEYYGGYEGGAADMSRIGLSGMKGSDSMQNWAYDSARRARGPQAWESQELSDLEAQSRGYDQAGALQLHREAAMGMAPSEAAYLMQSGLDRAMASQESLKGSARGGAALAMAQSNAAGNVANLQNQAYAQGGLLRAQEMANARGQYGELASQVRTQDQNRLGMGNQMGQFNAGLNDQYRLGMTGAAQGFGNQSLGYYQAAQRPYESQLGADVSIQQAGISARSQDEALAAGQGQAALDRAERDRAATMQAVGTGLQTAGTIYGANAQASATRYAADRYSSNRGMGGT